jgi:hypothetical protein
LTPDQDLNDDRLTRQVDVTTSFEIPAAPAGEGVQRITERKHLVPSPERERMVSVEIISRTRPSKFTPPSPESPLASKRLSIDNLRQSSISPLPRRTLVEKDRIGDLVAKFTALLEDIFEVDDAFNLEAENPSEDSLTFFAYESLREEKPWLSKEMHRKLDSHLRKLGKIKAARDTLSTHTNSLARITGICERAVKYAEEVDLKNLDDSEDAEQDWTVSKLGRIENAILAANVIMLLIAGRGTDQQVRFSLYTG